MEEAGGYITRLDHVLMVREAIFMWNGWENDFCGLLYHKQLFLSLFAPCGSNEVYIRNNPICFLSPQYFFFPIFYSPAPQDRSQKSKIPGKTQISLWIIENRIPQIICPLIPMKFYNSHHCIITLSHFPLWWYHQNIKNTLGHMGLSSP